MAFRYSRGRSFFVSPVEDPDRSVEHRGEANPRQVRQHEPAGSGTAQFPLGCHDSVGAAPHPSSFPGSSPVETLGHQVMESGASGWLPGSILATLDCDRPPRPASTTTLASSKPTPEAIHHSGTPALQNQTSPSICRGLRSIPVLRAAVVVPIRCQGPAPMR